MRLSRKTIAVLLCGAVFAGCVAYERVNNPPPPLGAYMFLDIRESVKDSMPAEPVSDKDDVTEIISRCVREQMIGNTYTMIATCEAVNYIHPSYYETEYGECWKALGMTIDATLANMKGDPTLMQEQRAMFTSCPNFSKENENDKSKAQ